MCGLFGALGNNLDFEVIKNIRTLGFLSQDRGKDSTGLAMSKLTKKGLQTKVLKKLQPSGVFFNLSDTVKFIKDNSRPNVIMGHARATTLGPTNILNAQPVQVDHIVGTHNGTIWGYSSDGISDSINLYADLTTMSVQDVVNKASKSWGDPAYALVWVNSQENTLNLLRNKERPLWTMRLNNVFYWSSDPNYLEFLDKQNYLEGEKISSVDVDTLFTIDLSTLVFTSKVMKPIKIHPVGLPSVTLSSRYPDYLVNSNNYPPFEDNVRYSLSKKEKKRLKKIHNERKAKTTNVVILGDFKYKGYFQRVYSYKEILETLQQSNGCCYCTVKPFPDEKIFWRNYEDYFCNSCFNSHFIKEFLGNERKLFEMGELLAA